MFRMIPALFLSLTLVLTSYGMAVARGKTPDIGTGMVICTGVGMTTITVGPDGEPVVTTHICPDAMSIFATSIGGQVISAPPKAMQWRITLPNATAARPAEALSPSARGPPLDV